jgi:hypothetical protein
MKWKEELDSWNHSEQRYETIKLDGKEIEVMISMTN